MRLVPRQWDRLPCSQRVLYIKPDFRMRRHGAKPMAGTRETPEGQVADAVRGNWVDTLAPAAARPYLRLSRADRPIGTWLLLLPCWWGVLLAASADPDGLRLFDLWIIVGCAIGAFLMRGAGCTWNDITDRDIDAAVARTKSRPIPSGQVSVRQALVWLVIQSLLALGILLTFNLNAILLGLLSLLPVAIYPFAKRFTWWPQVFLGLAFNWGALLAWTAHSGSLAWPAVALYLAGIAWTLFYDTIYAHQDSEDDALIGVKSTARLFGENSKAWLRGFLVASVVLMAVAIILALIPGGNFLALTLALAGAWAFGWHMAWQLGRLQIDEPETCMRLFRSNRDAGLLVALFFALSALL
ncbi:MAG: 4-hydroxybenzoate octaprenyltransferase [Roseicyclus sp.]|nr:4-hydroxybenzoate octaprenyltransferase [Roseicyclus sp.]MBO6625262.1 4-hydroxybenzoate octaprenyltransferase [Roseicyclus sp.]MBO6922527.1 4-hydroxybenzoate octaprenyltransferase [Roseicyclus sp.]